jgi:PAS domain S-box-containing protein
MIIASREKFEKINPAMVETLGYTEEELLMHPFLDFVHADDKENTQRKLRRFEALKHLNLKIDGFVKTILKWLVWSAIAEPTTGLMYAAEILQNL